MIVKNHSVYCVYGEIGLWCTAFQPVCVVVQISCNGCLVCILMCSKLTLDEHEAFHHWNFNEQVIFCSCFFYMASGKHIEILNTV